MGEKDKKEKYSIPIPIEEALRIARICYQCGECTGVCPLRRVSEFNPRVILYELLSGNMTSSVCVDADADANGDRDGDACSYWQCLICENCYIVCPQGVDLPSLVIQLRARDRATGNENELVAHRVLSEIVYFMSLTDRGVPVDFKGGSSPDSGNEYGYFPGCVDYLDLFMDVGVKFHEIGEYALMLLNEIGIKPKLLSLKCCGHDALFQGKYELFQRLATYNTRKIKEAGIKKLIVSCAEGFFTFKRYYNLEEEGISVIHISELLSDRLRFSHAERLHNDGLKVAYHDPCALKRFRLYDAPRNAIRQSGVKLVELAHSMDSALCCGVSGMMNCNDSSKALRTLRLAEAEAEDVDILITTCPKCLSHFNCLKHEYERGDRDARRYKFEIQDLVVFLGRLLERRERVAREEM